MSSDSEELPATTSVDSDSGEPIPLDIRSWNIHQDLRRIQALALAFSVLIMANSTVVIPESYALMVDMGYGAVASGWLIGSSWALQGFTILYLKSVSTALPFQRKKTCLTIAAVALAFSAVLYAACANPAPGLPSGCRVAGIIASRLGPGLACGVGQLFLSAPAQEVTPLDEAVAFSMWRSCVVTVGIGGGPLIASCACCLLRADSVHERASAPMYVMASAWVIFTVFLIMCLPSEIFPLLNAKLQQQMEGCNAACQNTMANQKDVPVKPETERGATRKFLWWCGVLFGVERAVTVSACEAASAFVLQDEFGWSTQAVGFAIGILFLASVPITLLANFVKQRGWLSEPRLMQLSTFVCALSATLLSPRLAPALRAVNVDPAMAILAADGLIFATGYFANGMIDGIACKSSIRNSPYTVENYLVIGGLLQNSFGRLCAPIFTRLVLDQRGRETYAIFQLLISLLGFATCLKLAQSLLPPTGRELNRRIMNIQDGISNTHMLATRLAQKVGLPGELILKLEGSNPTGSINDRCAEFLIRRAEERMDLVPFSGQRVIESSSGSMANALATICAQHGYNFIAVCDETDASNHSMAAAFGAVVVVVEGPPGANLADLYMARREYCLDLKKKDPLAFFVDHYYSPDTEMAYYHGIAPEIHEQLPDFDVISISTGTGGTLCGVSRYCKEKMPHVKVLACEPKGSATFAEPEAKNRFDILSDVGFRCAVPRVCRALQEGSISEIHAVEERDSVLTAIVLARTTGAAVGVRSGMAVFTSLCHMACASAERDLPALQVVAVCPDRLEPYRAELDGFLARHFRSNLQTEDLVHLLRERVTAVCKQCTHSAGMIGPAKIGFQQQQETAGRGGSSAVSYGDATSVDAGDTEHRNLLN